MAYTWKQFLLVSVLLVVIGGCAWLNKVAPNQVDATGKEIPGTHQVGQPIQDVAGVVPYGSFALNGMLLLWNLWEKAKANKTKAGFKATVSAIKQAADDPEIKAAMAKLKIYLESSQKAVGAQATVKQMIAQV